VVYCTKCGTEISEGSKYCQNCGTSLMLQESQMLSSKKYNNCYTTYEKNPVQILAERERISAIVWTIIACFQGLTSLSVTGGLIWLGELIGIDLGWGTLFSLGLAAFNGYGAYCSFQRVKRVKLQAQGIVAEYDAILTISVIAIVLNILLGSVLGIAGAVFDLFNRNYALKNAGFLENQGRDAL